MIEREFAEKEMNSNVEGSDTASEEDEGNEFEREIEEEGQANGPQGSEDGMNIMDKIRALADLIDEE